MFPQQGRDIPVAPEEVLFRQHSNQINISLTGFALNTHLVLLTPNMKVIT